MTKKKNLYNLHCRVKHSTAETLKTQSEELGIPVGEVVDLMIEGYVEYCYAQDEILEKTDIHSVLSKMMEKVDRIEKKVCDGN